MALQPWPLPLRYLCSGLPAPLPGTYDAGWAATRDLSTWSVCLLNSQWDAGDNVQCLRVIVLCKVHTPWQNITTQQGYQILAQSVCMSTTSHSTAGMSNAYFVALASGSWIQATHGNWFLECSWLTCILPSAAGSLPAAWSQCSFQAWALWFALVQNPEVWLLLVDCQRCNLVVHIISNPSCLGCFVLWKGPSSADHNYENRTISKRGKRMLFIGDHFAVITKEV